MTDLDNDQTWALKLFGMMDYYKLLKSSDQITYDEETGIVITLSLSNKQCHDMIKHFNNIRISGSIESTNYWAHFIAYFVNYLEDYMEDQPQVYDE